MTLNDSNSDQPQEVHFSDEEDIGDRMTPAKGLGAAYVIGLFALGALVLAALMPVIQMPYTAAGLLPGVTAITLFAMAISLGRRAIRMGAKVGFKDKFFAAIRTYFTSEEDMRTVGLFVFVGVYIIFLLELTFFYTITAFGIYRPIGSLRSTPLYF